MQERGQVTLSQSHGNDLTNKQTKARSVRTPIRHINYRKRNYTLMFENFKSEIPKDVLSFQGNMNLVGTQTHNIKLFYSEQHNAVLETKPLDAMNLKEIKRHLFRSKRCPAYERWRYSPNRDQFERDATTARGSFENLIISQQVSRVVHFVGDSSKTWQFTFLQYLAVLSAIRFIQPHSVYIHLAQEPDVDDSRYLEWWDDVLDSIPHLTLVKLDHGVPTSAEKILREYGGFVVPWDVLIFEELDAPLEERSNDGYSPVGISYMAEATFKIRHVSSSVDGIFKYDRKFLHENAWFRQVETNQTHPADFFTGDDPLSRNVRALMYASKSRIVAKSDPTTKIPLLCHYILIGNNYLKLEAFISMLSCLEIIGYVFIAISSCHLGVM